MKARTLLMEYEDFRFTGQRLHILIATQPPTNLNLCYVIICKPNTISYTCWMNYFKIVPKQPLYYFKLKFHFMTVTIQQLLFLTH